CYGGPRRMGRVPPSAPLEDFVRCPQPAESLLQHLQALILGDLPVLLISCVGPSRPTTVLRCVSSPSIRHDASNCYGLQAAARRHRHPIRGRGSGSLRRQALPCVAASSLAWRLIPPRPAGH